MWNAYFLRRIDKSMKATKINKDFLLLRAICALNIDLYRVKREEKKNMSTHLKSDLMENTIKKQFLCLIVCQFPWILPRTKNDDSTKNMSKEPGMLRSQNRTMTNIFAIITKRN